MNYYQVELTLLFKAKVAYVKANETLAKNMALVMLNDPYLKNIHGQTGFKPYVFSLPYPYEKVTKTYESNKPYRFMIRSIDETFIYSLSKELSIHKGLDFHVIGTNIQRKKQFFIDTLYTVTPTLITLKSDTNTKKQWTIDEGDIMMIKERITVNLAKKYRHFFAQEIDAPTDAIQYIELIDPKPIAIKYKNTTFLTNKFKLGFNSDEVSQKLAFVAMSLGVGEKNTLGLGHCLTGSMR